MITRFIWSQRVTGLGQRLDPLPVVKGFDVTVPDPQREFLSLSRLVEFQRKTILGLLFVYHEKA